MGNWFKIFKRGKKSEQSNQVTPIEQTDLQRKQQSTVSVKYRVGDIIIASLENVSLSCKNQSFGTELIIKPMKQERLFERLNYCDIDDWFVDINTGKYYEEHLGETEEKTYINPKSIKVFYDACEDILKSKNITRNTMLTKQQLNQIFDEYNMQQILSELSVDKEEHNNQDLQEDINIQEDIQENLSDLYDEVTEEDMKQL